MTNIGGGIVVGKVGTATATLRELDRELLRSSTDATGELIRRACKIYQDAPSLAGGDDVTSQVSRIMARFVTSSILFH